MDSDIALLHLAEPLEFNHGVRPVCLPAPEEAVQPSRVCVVTGWGAREKGTRSLLASLPVCACCSVWSYSLCLYVGSRGTHLLKSFHLCKLRWTCRARGRKEIRRFRLRPFETGNSKASFRNP